MLCTVFEENSYGYTRRYEYGRNDVLFRRYVRKEDDAENHEEHEVKQAQERSHRDSDLRIQGHGDSDAYQSSGIHQDLQREIVFPYAQDLMPFLSEDYKDRRNEQYSHGFHEIKVQRSENANELDHCRQRYRLQERRKQDHSRIPIEYQLSFFDI
jgi:hypothetical protein